MGAKTTKPMNDHVYRKLKRLWDGRNSGANGRDEYLRGLVTCKVSEADLVAEIERRLKL